MAKNSPTPTRATDRRPRAGSTGRRPDLRSEPAGAQPGGTGSSACPHGSDAGRRRPRPPCRALAPGARRLEAVSECLDQPSKRPCGEDAATRGGRRRDTMREMLEGPP